MHLFISYSVYWISSCPHTDQILLKLPEPQKRLSRPGTLVDISTARLLWEIINNNIMGNMQWAPAHCIFPIIALCCHLLCCIEIWLLWFYCNWQSIASCAGVWKSIWIELPMVWENASTKVGRWINIKRRCWTVLFLLV